MQHNRPYYCSEQTKQPQQVALLLSINDRSIRVLDSLSRWLEQIYIHTQIIVYDATSQCAAIQEIFARHKRKINMSVMNQLDDIYISIDKPCSYHDIAKLYEKIGLKHRVLIFADNTHAPAPYFIEIALLCLNENQVINCNGCIICDRKDFAESNISLIDSSLLPRFQPTKLDHKKCTVFIPCMDRGEYLQTTLPMWIEQKYPHKQIVVIDYSSKKPIEPLVRAIAEQHKMQVRDDGDIVLMRVPNMRYFNISHAYNYAIKRLPTDVICTVCADSCPRDYYLDTVMNIIDDKSLVQCWWGLHTITYENWRRLNGHQEFVVGWGGEDDDFRHRAEIMGLRLIHIPDSLIFQMPQDNSTKGKNRQITDIWISSDINVNRFNSYIAAHGYVANYGEEIGLDQPIDYRSEIIELPKIYFCSFKSPPKELPPALQPINETTHFALINGDLNREWASYEAWRQYGEIETWASYRVLNHSQAEIDNKTSRFMKQYVQNKGF